MNSFFWHLENKHKEECQKLCLVSIPKWQVDKEEVESEKTEKNIKEATHEWTSVVGSNKKKLKQKHFFKKATDGFVTVYNGGRGHLKTIKTSEAVDY